METLLILIIVILVIMLFIQAGSRNKLVTAIRRQRTLDPVIEEEVVKLLNSGSYYSARKTARIKYGMTNDEFQDMYGQLGRQRRVKFKWF